MLSEGMKIFTDIPIVVVGMGLFLLAFVIVTARIFLRPNSKSYYRKIAEMPLKNEDDK